MTEVVNKIIWLDKPLSLSTYSDYSDQLIRVKSGWRRGYLDSQGNVVIPFEYETLDEWKHGLSWCSKNGEYRYIDKHNNTVISGDKYYFPDYYAKGISYNGLIRVGTLEEPRRWGFVNTKGEEAIDLLYEEVGLFSNGLAVVKKEGKYGYINEAGKLVIPCRYDEAEAFDGRLAIVKQGNNTSVINLQGEEIIKPGYDFLEIYWGCLVSVCLNDKWGVFNEKGEQIVPFEYDYITTYNSNGYAQVEKDKKCGLIDKNGKLVVPLNYRSVSYFKEGFAEVAVGKRGKSYVDLDGKEMNARFDDVLFGFTEGLAAVKKRKKWGFINTLGEEVIPCQYVDTTGFRNGLARVMDENGKCGYINPQNEIVIPLEYDWMHTFDDRPVVGVQSGYNPIYKKYPSPFEIKHGLIDRQNNLLLPIEFDEVIVSEKGDMVFVLKQGQWGILNT